MRRVVLAIVGTVASLVMLLSFKTHSASPVTTPPAAVAATGSSDTGATSSGATGSGTTSTTTKSTSSASKKVTGDAVQTRYGPVQVQVTVTNGKVTAVSAVDYPQSNPRDAQINAYAIPVLDQEATAAGSASIDMVSGATYTSEGYLQSLQSALDKV